MTNDPIYDRLRESGWRRKLTPAEEAELRAWLAAHPQREADWEAEAGLNEALGMLPDAPVPGNFTARVLQEVEREQAAAARRLRRKWLFWTQWRWLPRLAMATVVLGTGFFAYEQATRAARRAEYMRSVAAISEVASLPGPDALKDFDAIRVSNPTPAADEELLAALR